MRNNLLDEIIADYMGIIGANGRYRADWFLAFVGLGEADRYREGARLEHYRGDPPLSDEAFAILQVIVRRAAAELERFDERRPDRVEPATTGRLILGLTRLTLEEMAGEQAQDRLAQAMGAG